MANINIGDERLIVPRALKHAYDTTPVRGAASAAQVSGADREPALVLLESDHVVLVSPRGTRRWPVGEIERVEDVRILTHDGAEVGISGWWYSGQSQRFRAALRERIGQPAPLAGIDSTPPPALVPASGSKDGLAKVVSVLSVMGATALLVLLSAEGLGSSGLALLGVLGAAVLGPPLLICGVRLAATGSDRRVGLGVVGALLGLAGVAVLVLAIVVAVALSSCTGGCF